MLEDKCVRCGSCVKFCPMFDAIGEEQYSPRGKIYLLQVMDLIEGDEELAKEFRRVLFECTMCGRCSEICASDVDLLRIWHEQRLKAFKKAPEEFEYLDSLRSAIANVRNIYGLPMEDRAIYWADEIEQDIPHIQERIYEPSKKAEVAVFLGCLMSFRGTQIDVVRTLIQGLERADVDYLVMGAEEFCCGHPLDLMGDEEGAKDLQEHNKQVFKDMGAKKVITACPGCLYQLKTNHQVDGLEALHHTQFFDRYYEHLPTLKMSDDFAYHDPCELHRLCDVKIEPRSLLAKMGVVYRDLEVSCCGGGGLLRMTDPKVSDKIIELRKSKERLANTNVITACPACREQLLNAEVETVDIAELLEHAFRNEGEKS